MKQITFTQSNRILSISALSSLLDKSRVSIWRWTKSGILPKPIMINGKTLGWKESVISQWLDDNQGGK
jgi:prophage regulatory protein